MGNSQKITSVIFIFLFFFCNNLFAANDSMDDPVNAISEISEKSKAVVDEKMDQKAESVTTGLVNDSSINMDKSQTVENKQKKDEIGNLNLYIIPVEGTIEPGLAGFIERSIKEAESASATHVIFRIDTLGGRVDSATKIKDLIISSSIPHKIAYIDKKAISAGAFIALSTQQIIMAPGGTIGAAMPVTIGFGGSSMQPTNEKIVSYLRKEFKAVAEINGYPTDIAQAFVDKDVEVEGISKKGKLLTLTTEEALACHLASMKVDTMDNVIAALELESATKHETTYTWSEKLTRILTHPMLTSVLMTIGLLGIIVEIKTPGFGLPGIIGISAILIFFFAQHLVGLANHTELLIFAVGCVLLLIEVFVIPGFGLCGVLGIAAIFGSLLMALLKRPLPEIPISKEQYLHGIYLLSRSVVMTVAGVYFLYKFVLPRVPTLHPIILKKEETHDDGFVAMANHDELVGKVGKAISALRPAGKAMFDNKLVDVITESEFLEKDETIVVLRVEGMKIIVAKQN